MFGKTISINHKLVFFVVMVSLVAIFTTDFLIFNSSEKIIKENTQDLLIGEASIRGESVVNLLQAKINDIEVLAKNPVMYDLVKEMNQMQAVKKPGYIYSDIKRDEFLQIVNQYSKTAGHAINLEDVVIIGKSGDIFFSLAKTQTNDHNVDLEIIEGLNDNSVQEPVLKLGILEDKTRNLVILHPILKDEYEDTIENPEGLLVVHVRTDDVDEILLNRSGLGKSGEVYLVNNDHLLISESRFIDDAAFNYTADTLPVIKCFEDGQNVDGITYDDYRGVSIFGASYCEKEHGFVLIAEIDEAEMLEPVKSLQSDMLIVGIMVTVGIGIIAFILANLVSRPLVHLTNAVNEVADGNFGIRTNIRTNDEIGILSASFDSMAKKLQEALISIKQRDDVIRQQEDDLLKFSDFDHSYCVGFVDIVGSTKITSALSDSKTDKFYSIFLNSIASVIQKFEGLVVKNVGDALLFYFPRTNSTKDLMVFKNTLDCCFAMIDSHDQIRQKLENEKLPKLDYRISMVYGSVRIAKVLTSSIEDIFGNTVNKCSKINRLAKPNGIVIDNSLHDIVKSLDTPYGFEKLESEDMIKKYGYGTIYSVSRKSSRE